MGIRYLVHQDMGELVREGKRDVEEGKRTEKD